MVEIKQIVLRCFMSIYNNRLYSEDIGKVTNLAINWDKLHNKSMLISGSTGLLGSFFTDVLMQKNSEGLGCKIYILGRSESKARNRFSFWWDSENLNFINYDVNQPLKMELGDKIDYVVHLASNTHPLQYATDPVGTITTNVFGLKHLLDFAVKHHCERFVFASSNEIYGENRGDTELFNEDYCGYINSNTLRAGYPESKRCGEALCQAYISKYDLDVVIPRFTRSYGPSMLTEDTKAISQFIKKGVYGEDIVLKSAGTQNYSYTYMADAVSGLLTVLLNGESGEAYNVSDEQSNITLKDLATIIADYVGKEVVFEIPDTIEAAGYSKATKALLDGSKLKALGWNPFYSIKEGIPRTIQILRSELKDRNRNHENSSNY